MTKRIHLDRSRSVGLSDQITSQISHQIFEGLMPSGLKLPSCRGLARQLGVSVNTAIAAYQTLEKEQLIEARPRSGFFVRAAAGIHPQIVQPAASCTETSARILQKLGHYARTSGIETIQRPQNWYTYKFPFVCNQIDETDFPLAEWRECTRLAMNRKDLKIWSADGHNSDSADLIRQINQRVLPRRGILANSDTTLITMGSQNGLFLTSLLLGGMSRVAAMEDPGYPDARKILTSNFGQLRFQPVDHEGLVVDERLQGVDLVFTTPNRQFPTTVTMSERRRHDLLSAANAYDFYIVEDDYESDVDYRQSTPRALRTMDDSGRVIYLGSMSKGLSPGLRLGYINAESGIIAAARDCRGMMLRHPPYVIQHTAAVFIELGYFDGHLSRRQHDYKHRWHLTDTVIRQKLQDFDILGEYGGTNFVATDTKRKLNAERVACAALECGIVLEPIAACYSVRPQGEYCFRIGVSSMPRALILEGLEKLAELLVDMRQLSQ